MAGGGTQPVPPHLQVGAGASTGLNKSVAAFTARSARGASESSTGEEGGRPALLDCNWSDFGEIRHLSILFPLPLFKQQQFLISPSFSELGADTDAPTTITKNMYSDHSARNHCR